MKRALVSWSSGKDSAWALHVARQEVEVVGLLTTIDERLGGVAAHGVPRALVEAQAAALGLPLRTVDVPWPSPNTTYEHAMGAAFRAAAGEGIEVLVFGDLFLADIRQYRESQLTGTGLTPLFPLWGRDTRELAHEMIAGGLRAFVVAVDPSRAPREIAGTPFDETLLSRLPTTCDPCAENGEFHSFSFGGPMFQRAVNVTAGPAYERGDQVFVELTALPTLFHVVRPGELVWNTDDRYAPPSLAKEGFLHASFAEKVVESAQLYFSKDEFASLRVLVIDPAKLDCEVRIVGTPRGPMPHIHGSVPRAAATEVSIQRMPFVSSSASK